MAMCKRCDKIFVKDGNCQKICNECNLIARKGSISRHMEALVNGK